jgi:hypothetical protein
MGGEHVAFQSRRRDGGPPLAKVPPLRPAGSDQNDQKPERVSHGSKPLLIVPLRLVATVILLRLRILLLIGFVVLLLRRILLFIGIVALLWRRILLLIGIVVLLWPGILLLIGIVVLLRRRILLLAGIAVGIWDPSAIPIV